MTEFAVLCFKQALHLNLNLAVLVVLAWLLIGRGKGRKTSLMIWGVLLIRALAEPLLCPQFLETPPVDYGSPGTLSIGLGLGWAQQTVSVVLGVGTEMLSVGDLAVEVLGLQCSAALGVLGLALVASNLVWRLLRLIPAFGNDERLVWSEDAHGPHIRGWWKPSIVMPVKLRALLSEDELKAVIWHEEAHIKRGDHRWFAMMYLLRAFCLVIWPLMIILDALEQVAERSCDSLAAKNAGAFHTAQALLKTAEFQSGRGNAEVWAHFGSHPVKARILALRQGGGRESILVGILSLFLVAAIIL